jgi:hypothetical protein
VLVAIFLGRVINLRMKGLRFMLYVQLGLTVIGTILLWKAASGWSLRQH